MDRQVFADCGRITEHPFFGHDVYNPMHIRWTVTLDHQIDAELLRQAWERTKRVYPIIDAVLTYDAGTLDVYFDPEYRAKHPDDHLYLAVPEEVDGVNVPVKSKVPLVPKTEVVANRLMTVTYYEDTFSLNSFHMLVDGGGLNMVFKTLLYSYLALYTGHEDENPIVELREGRNVEDYYVEVTAKTLWDMDYTPVPFYTLPPDCKGFKDDDMVNPEGELWRGSLVFNVADFIKLCKSNGANPSAMLCSLLGKAVYALNPSREEDIVFGLTVTSRSIMNLNDSIANVVSYAIAHASRDEIVNGPLDTVSKRIRAEVDQQRSLDYYISYGRILSSYKLEGLFTHFTVTYIGAMSIGDNDSHIVDFQMGTNGDNNLFLIQVKDKFVLIPMYGRATAKYLDEFQRVFEEVGVTAEVSHPAALVDLDSPTPVL